jgi:hypothetical protein
VFAICIYVCILLFQFTFEYGLQPIHIQQSNNGGDNVDHVINVLTQVQEEYKSSGRVL